MAAIDGPGPASVQRRIGSNSILSGLALNIGGALASATAAVVCVREIVVGLGVTRFGVLSLAWTLINAVGILDLGIGRALTRYLAIHEEHDPRQEAAVVWTALATVALLGAVGAVILSGAANQVAEYLAHGDSPLAAEATSTLQLLALSIPLVVLSSGLRGVLEALGRFDLSGRVSIPITLLNVLLPAGLVRVENSLPLIVLVLVALRGAGTLVLLASVISILPEMRRPRLTGAGIRAVLSLGGWITVSNMCGPLFAQAERVLLGSIRELAAVTYYATPADVLARVTILPAAVMQVMFPALAQALAMDRHRADRLITRSLILIAAAVMPVLTIFIAIAPEALRVWLGVSFSELATTPARILALALFLNCMTWLPFSLLQGAGRADLAAKINLLEIPIHLTSSAALIYRFGATGAAVANLLRVSLDGALVLWGLGRVLGRSHEILSRYWLIVGLGVVSMASAAWPESLWLRCIVAMACVVGYGVVVWRGLLNGAERQALRADVDRIWTRSVLRKQ